MDFEILDEVSGGAGGFQKSMQACDKLNDGLTALSDAISSPDETDSFDASCNTCKHFQRHAMTPEQRAERSRNGMPGHCLLKDVPVKGWHRGHHCGFENESCYENRRTGMRPNEARPWGEI
jgi:hypothetical protein